MKRGFFLTSLLALSGVSSDCSALQDSYTKFSVSQWGIK